MISLPKLTESDLKVFEKKSVVIYGSSSNAKQLRDIFADFNIEVIAYCDNGIKSLLHKKSQGLPIISDKQLEALSKKKQNIIVQKSGPYKKIDHIDIEASDLEAGLIFKSFFPQLLLKREFTDQYMMSWKKRYKEKNRLRELAFIRSGFENKILICLPMKTADHTLNATFDYLNSMKNNQSNKKCLYDKFDAIALKLFKCKNNCIYRGFTFIMAPFDKNGAKINYINLFHRVRAVPNLINKNNKITKIIVAVREPISQNLSSMCQGVYGAELFEDWILGEIENKSKIQSEKSFQKLESIMMENGDNIQVLFDAFIKRYIYTEAGVTLNSSHARAIQSFFIDFENHVLDITAYPFDQEKGYGVIKEASVEIFIYQLEKLNMLIPELSNWVGIPFDKLVNDNKTEDKWIGECYQQALKEIEITQEYFDKCFNEPYVKHCYSEADIEKFKARWRPHIKKEA